MAYPNPPSFISAEPFSAWWGVTQGSSVRLCATQGMSFLKRLQRRLASRSLTGRSVPESGAWDQATADALAQHAADLQAAQPAAGWSVTADRLRQAAAAHEIPSDALRFAIFVAYLEGTTNTFDMVTLRPDTIYPVFGVAPANDLAWGPADGGATCWDPATQTPPTGTQPSQPIGPTQGGITTGATGGTGLTLGQDQGMGMGMMGPALVLAGGVVALGAIYYFTRPKKKSSKSKSSKRSKAA